MLPTKYRNKREMIRDLVIDPLLESKRHLIGIPNIKTLSENKITDHVVRYLRFCSKVSGLYKRNTLRTIVRATAVYKNTPNNEPDLEIVMFGEHSIIFEAKRINRNSTPSEYCGVNGLHRLINGYYSIKVYCGMLGYMQTGKLSKRVASIKKIINNNFSVKMRIITNECFSCIHKCQNKRMICYHLIFDLTGR